MTIKLIALDLDGTTLRDDKELSEATKEVFLEAIKKDIHVVIATGRCFHSLPKVLDGLEGLEYAITSNGADIRELTVGTSIYKNCIDPTEIENIYRFLKRKPFMTEVFTDGRAYISQEDYDKVLNGEYPSRTIGYVKGTRIPMPELLEFMLSKKDEIENINLFFFSEDERIELINEVNSLKNITLTSSMSNNCEIGSKTTSKATGLIALMDRLGIYKEEIMAVGDSPNDIEMLKLAGVSVAVENAVDSVKNVAKYITDSNKNDGVANAIKKYAL
ncbi:MAG: Cof-type HAD-IIB family hydrolase [Anaerovoracaceae bacterium]